MNDLVPRNFDRVKVAEHVVPAFQFFRWNESDHQLLPSVGPLSQSRGSHNDRQPSQHHRPCISSRSSARSAIFVTISSSRNQTSQGSIFTAAAILPTTSCSRSSSRCPFQIESAKATYPMPGKGSDLTRQTFIQAVIGCRAFPKVAQKLPSILRQGITSYRLAQKLHGIECISGFCVLLPRKRHDAVNRKESISATVSRNQRALVCRPIRVCLLLWPTIVSVI